MGKCISETVGYGRFIQEKLFGRCRCAISRCNHDLTFDLAIEILTFRISETIRYRTLIFERDLAGRVRGDRCALSL